MYDGAYSQDRSDHGCPARRQRQRHANRRRCRARPATVSSCSTDSSTGPESVPAIRKTNYPGCCRRDLLQEVQSRMPSRTYSVSGATPMRRNVLSSRRPWKYLSSSRSNTEPAGDTHANRSRRTSASSRPESRISRTRIAPRRRELPRQHSPAAAREYGWLRYASASATLLIEYRLEVELNPSPSNCGKDVPHPMRPLPAAPDLGECLLVVSPLAPARSGSGRADRRRRWTGSHQP